ncbi:MAG TPA: PfkB family carbohydrate kinase, partial [Burkholderiales bacterium]|nr:PfkB family carbohydrate kinase [Burkholderiales bacterium]
AQGAELHAQGQILRQASAQVKIADTVGAGDASIGGLLFSLITHGASDWQNHLRWAVAAGSAACMQSGAVPPPLAAIESVLATMQ